MKIFIPTLLFAVGCIAVLASTATKHPIVALLMAAVTLLVFFKEVLPAIFR